MAGKTSNSDFQAIMRDLGGDSYSADLPAYVLDKTARELFEALVTSIAKSDTENKKGLKNLAKDYREALKTETNNNAETNENLNQKTKEHIDEATARRMKQADKIANQEMQDRDKFEKDLTAAMKSGAEKGGRIGGDLFVTAIKGLATIFATSGGILISSFSNLGSSLRTLTDTGQAFGDQLGAGTSTTVDNIVAMNQLGLTTEEAVASLSTYSRAMSSMGQKNLIGLNAQFLTITDNGRSLGVTLDEATEFFLQDQQLRARTLNKDRIDQTITAQLTMQSIQNLRGFSAILGQSTDAIRQQSEGVIDSNMAMRAFTNSLSPGRATEMNQIARSLVDGLIAVFPAQGEELSSALLTVAGTGVGAITQFANMLGPLGGDFYTEFQNLASSLRSGTITMDDVPKAIQGIVEASANNVDNLENLAVIAGLEGHPMADVAKMVIGMQQDASVARERLQKLADDNGMEFSRIQTVTTGFENILRNLRGGYSSLLNSIPIAATKELGTNFDALLKTFGGDGGVSILTSELNRAGVEIGKAIGATINALAGDDGFATTISKLVDDIIRISKSILNRITRIIKSFEKDGQVDILGAITKFTKEAMGAFFEAVGEAFKLVPWGDVLPIAAIGLAFTGLTSAIGVMFGIAATVAGNAFALAALKISAGSMVGGGFGGKVKGVGKFIKGAAPVALALGGATMFAGDIGETQSESPYERKKGRNSIIGGIGGMILAGLATAAIVGTGGLAAIPLATALTVGGGSYIAGSYLGGKTAGEKPQNEKRKQAQITSPSMQMAASTGINARYLDSMTDPGQGNQTNFTASEINKIDKETPETKALAFLLAENKSLNRKIQSIINDGLKVKIPPNRG